VDEWLQWFRKCEQFSRDNGSYQNMLLDFIEKETDRLSGMALESLTPERWPNEREEVRREIYGALGLNPLPPRTDLNAKVVGYTEFEGYRIEKVVFEPRPSIQVPGLLYLPNVNEPAPAILYSLGHWMTWSKSEQDIQAACVGLVKLGFVVFVFDPIGQGERGPSFHDHAHRELLPLGHSQEGITVWEHMRAIDYLAARSEVNSLHIGMTGASGGGLTTFFTSALDDRIKVSVPVCFASTYSQYLRAVRGMNWDGVEDLCNQVPNVIPTADAAGIAGLIAPRPLLMINGRQDPHFTVEGALEVKRQVSPIYEPANVDRIQVVSVDSGHGYSKLMREAAYGWFCKWLREEGDGSPIQEPEMSILPVDAQELRCFGGDIVSSSTAIADFVKSTAEQMGLDRYGNVLKIIDKELVRNVLGLDLAPDHAATGTLEETARFGDLVCERHLIVPEPGITVPALWVKPPANSGKIVLYLDDRQKTSGYFESLVQQGLANGFGVISLDPRGVGETVPVPPPVMTLSTLEGPLEEIVPSEDEHLEFEVATDSVMLGRSLLGQQVMDILGCLNYFNHDETGLDSITIVANGPLSSLRALFAASLDNRVSAVVAGELPLSCLEIVLDEKASMPITAYIYGLLRHFDFKDLVSLMPGRSLFIANPVDSRNRHVQLEQCLQVYREAGQFLRNTGGNFSVKLRCDLSEVVGGTGFIV
jgi:hypothetical protein